MTMQLVNKAFKKLLEASEHERKLINTAYQLRCDHLTGLIDLTSKINEDEARLDVDGSDIEDLAKTVRHMVRNSADASGYLRSASRAVNHAENEADKARDSAAEAANEISELESAISGFDDDVEQVSVLIRAMNEKRDELLSSRTDRVQALASMVDSMPNDAGMSTFTLMPSVPAFEPPLGSVPTSS